MRWHMGLFCKPYRIALILAFASLCSAWMCTAVVNLDNCREALRRINRRGSISSDWCTLT